MAIYDINEEYHKTIQKVPEIMKEYMEQDLPKLSVFAGQLKMTETSLKRLFKKYYGCSIYKYYLIKKMEHAKHLIESEGLSVTETAVRLKYRSVFNFIRTFRVCNGVRPGQIKKAARKNNQ